MIRLSGLALVLCAATAAHGAEKTFERTFTVSPGESPSASLIVDADAASVTVSGNDSRQVTVRMRARASESVLENLKFDAYQKDGAVTVILKRERKGAFGLGSWNLDGDIEVTVPRNFRVDVQTRGGSVELNGTEGAASLRSSGGDIRARRVSGPVQLRTSGGSIVAESIRGDVDATTSGGDVRLLQVDGRVRGRTSGGSVKCSLVGANRGISASTSGGSIDITVPASTTANVSATTGGGDIRVDLPIVTTRKTEDRVEGSLNGGGQAIEAHTSGGDISLRAAG